MQKLIRIGTRESKLAVWQSELVKKLLEEQGYKSELVLIKSEGDIDLQTPLYEMGVQGVFTRSLDIALLNKKIDIAVHSMKDVPTQLAKGIVQAAVLKRASYKDLFVYKEATRHEESAFLLNALRTSNLQPQTSNIQPSTSNITIATSSIRRKSQWLNKFPNHTVVNLRGNVNTRMQKVQDNDWNGAIFAAAGLERIGLRPENSIELDWMLPAPAQGAIMIVAREADEYFLDGCMKLNDVNTAICTKIERDFLKHLLGGCSTPISALAEIKDGKIYFRGNILSIDGKEKAEIEMFSNDLNEKDLGIKSAIEILNNGGKKIADSIRNVSK